MRAQFTFPLQNLVQIRLQTKTKLHCRCLVLEIDVEEVSLLSCHLGCHNIQPRTKVLFEDVSIH